RVRQISAERRPWSPLMSLPVATALFDLTARYQRSFRADKERGSRTALHCCTKSAVLLHFCNHSRRWVRSMLDSSARASPQFALDEDQIAVRDMARDFADEVFAPNAVAWDEGRHFPVAEMRKAAALGMGGVYIAEDVGGSGLSRLTATLIFEALATG